MVEDYTQTTYVICKMAHSFRHGQTTASIAEELQGYGVTVAHVETAALRMQPFFAPRSGRYNLAFIGGSEREKVQEAIILGLWADQWDKPFKDEAASLLTSHIATEPDRVRVAYLYALGQLGVTPSGLSDQLLALSTGTGLVSVCAREAYDLIGFVKDEHGVPMQWDLWSIMNNGDDDSIRVALRRARGARLRDDLSRRICELALTRPGLAHDCFSTLRNCKLDVRNVACRVIDGVGDLDSRVDEGSRRLLTYWLNQPYASDQTVDALYMGVLESPEKIPTLLELTRRSLVREKFLHRVRTEARREIIVTVVHYLREAYEDGEEQALEAQLLEMLSHKSIDVRRTALQVYVASTASWGMLERLREFSAQPAFASMSNDISISIERIEEKLFGATWKEAKSFGVGQEPPPVPELYDTFVDRVIATIQSEQRYGLPEYPWWFEVSNDYLNRGGVEKIRFTPVGGVVLVTTAPKHLEFRLDKSLLSLGDGFGFLLTYSFAAYEAMVTAKFRFTEVPNDSFENHYRIDLGATKRRGRGSPIKASLRVPRRGDSAGSRSSGSESGSMGEVIPAYVSPHIRRLPSGHASNEAHKHAAKHLMQIAPGYTFVAGYWKPRGYVPDENDQSERMVTALDILNETIRKYLRGGGL